MQIIHFKDLKFPIQEVLNELLIVYKALKEAAVKENDLRTYIIADLSLTSLEHAQAQIAQPQCYPWPLHYYKAEVTDSIENIITERMGYVYNSPMA